MKPGGKIVYPACETVETITPVVKLRAKQGPEHIYEAWLVGPKAAGESQGRERVFSGKNGVFEYPVIAIAFPKLTRTVNKTHFLAGTYTLQMRFGSKRAKPKTVETVKLATKRGCSRLAAQVSMRDPRQGAGAGLGQLRLVERGLAGAAVADARRRTRSLLRARTSGSRVRRRLPRSPRRRPRQEAFVPRAEFRRGRQGSYRAPGLNHSISLEDSLPRTRCC